MEMLVYALIAMVVSYAVSASMAPKPVDAVPATQDEFNFPQTEEGTPQAVIFGDVWVSSWTIIDLNNFRTTSIERDDGKK